LYADNDRPAEQVNVVLWTAERIVAAATVTSWGGEFYIEEVDPGQYLLSAGKPGCELLWETVDIPQGAGRLTLRLKGNCASGEGTVSVRDLSIPLKARMAMAEGIRVLKSDPSEARGHLLRAAELFPDYYEAYHVLGLADLIMERQLDAEHAFRRSIALSERRYARPLLALGAVLCDQERFAEAEAFVRQGLAMDGTPWIGHLMLGRILFALDRWDEAEESAHKALLRRPEASDAYLLLAHIHQRQNDAAAVLRDLDQFLKLEPQGDISAEARKVREKLVAAGPVIR
jgi:tetratricopeptide (TPR) repeat protein